MKQFFLLGIIFIYSHISFSQNRILFPEEKLPGINYFDRSSRTGNDLPFIKTDSIIGVKINQSKNKVIFEYNNNGKISEYIEYLYDYLSQSWDPANRHCFFYNDVGDKIEELELYWPADSSSRIRYFYEAGRVSSSTFEVYGNGWSNWYLYSYVYTEQGYIKEWIIQEWVNDQWQNSDRATFFYSYSELRDSILFERWDNNQWMDDRKTLFFYSSNNIDVDSIYYKSWDGASWNNLQKEYIVNDNNHNQIEVTDQVWDGNSFINYEKRFYSYNEAGYVLTGNALVWDNGSWVQGDGGFKLTSPPDSLVQLWIANYVYGYYTDVTAVGDNNHLNELGYSLSENYPNPFNPSTTIEYSLPEYSSVAIKIFDILGKEIEILVSEEKSKGNYKFIWNAKGLPSGVYFCRMQSGGYVQTRKMILMK